jgi:two-component system, NarL family, sensor kinase
MARVAGPQVVDRSAGRRLPVKVRLGSRVRGLAGRPRSCAVTLGLGQIKARARGVFPPLLTAQGLPAALSARTRSCPIETSVTADGIGRYSAEIEGTMYFCCLEALQNALHHAQSSQVRIHLEQRSGELIFEGRDDGIGLSGAADHTGSGLQGMRDRLDVHGGRLEVNSEPGRGTLVIGWVPAEPIGTLP